MRWSRVLLAAWVMLAPGLAHAGCPHLCEISEAWFTLEPELACANVRVDSDDCDCGISVRIENTCELPLEARTFDLRCGPVGSPLSSGCRSVEPTERGSFELPIHATGRTERMFTLHYEGQDHVLTVAADVSSFDDGAICSVTGRVARGGAPVWSALLAMTGVFVLLRRSRRS